MIPNTTSGRHLDDIWTTSDSPIGACLSRLWLIALLALAHAFATSPVQADTFADAFTDAIALHDAARAGDEDSLEAAVESFKRLGSKQPNNAEVIAYLGSAYAISAREGFNVISKMRNTNRALRQLDRALELAPDNFTVRMIRANVHRNLPGMFGRDDDAIADMLALHDIFTQAIDPPPRMAESMLPIYDGLIEEAPDRQDWVAARAKALQIAN